MRQAGLITIKEEEFGTSTRGAGDAVGAARKIEKVVQFGAFWCMTCAAVLAGPQHVVLASQPGRLRRVCEKVMHVMHRSFFRTARPRGLLECASVRRFALWRPVSSNVGGCNISEDAKNVAFRCILLHRVTYWRGLQKKFKK